MRMDEYYRSTKSVSAMNVMCWDNMRYAPYQGMPQAEERRAIGGSSSSCVCDLWGSEVQRVVGGGRVCRSQALLCPTD